MAARHARTARSAAPPWALASGLPPGARVPPPALRSDGHRRASGAPARSPLQAAADRRGEWKPGREPGWGRAGPALVPRGNRGEADRELTAPLSPPGQDKSNLGPDG